MGLFTKTDAEKNEIIELKRERMTQLKNLTNEQLTMYAIATMVDGTVYDEQVLAEMGNRTGNIPDRIEE